MTRIRWIVSGRVQGVGFRWATKRRALEIGVVGRVHNRPDGTVEVTASGTPEQLELLGTFLETGPAFASVDHVEKSDISHEIFEHKDFEVN